MRMLIAPPKVALAATWEMGKVVMAATQHRPRSQTAAAMQMQSAPPMEVRVELAKPSSTTSLRAGTVAMQSRPQLQPPPAAIPQRH
jgi:hypothetical protein